MPAHERLGDYATAMRCYRTALGIAEETGHHQTDPFLHSNIGRACHYQGRHRLALKHLRKSLRLARAGRHLQLECELYEIIGWVYKGLGDLDASLENLRRAYAKQPDPDIAAHLGEVLWASGERDEARRVWDEGRKKDARNKALIETIRRLTQ